VLLRREGGLEVLEAGGPLVGLGAGLAFDEGELTLRPGDRLFMYTDGLVELAAPDGQQYGEDRLHDAIAAVRGVPLDAACERLVERALVFGDGNEPQDDITLLALEFAGGGRADGDGEPGAG
jgi:sigma-B regulation protein RsbU (phosphoserine phosphatase)